MAVRQSEACIYNIPTKDIHVALFLTDNLKFSYDFKVSKPKRSKRLYICLVPLPTHVHKGRNRRETKAKVRILIDITPFFIRKEHIWHLVPEPACELCDQARAELGLLKLY